jgi:uncharacterized protein YceK
VPSVGETSMRSGLVFLLALLLLLLSGCGGTSPVPSKPVSGLGAPWTECKRVWKYDDPEGCVKRQAGQWDPLADRCLFDDCTVTPR